MCVCVCTSACMWVYPSVRPFVRPSVCLSVCRKNYHSVFLGYLMVNPGRLKSIFPVFRFRFPLKYPMLNVSQFKRLTTLQEKINGKRFRFWTEIRILPPILFIYLVIFLRPTIRLSTVYFKARHVMGGLIMT